MGIDASIQPRVLKLVREGIGKVPYPVLLILESSLEVARKLATPAARVAGETVAALVQRSAAQKLLRKVGSPQAASAVAGRPPVAGVWMVVVVKGFSTVA